MNEVCWFVGVSKTARIPEEICQTCRIEREVESRLRGERKSMNTPARVLLVGHHHRHLEVRASVLHHFWEVTIASPEQSEVPIFLADLVVLCHTIPEAERQQWVIKVRHQMPSMLIVRMNGFDSGPHAGADATVSVEHGPGALVSTIYELLTERGLESRDWPDSGDPDFAGDIQ
jgi:hypothetical protein